MKFFAVLLLVGIAVAQSSLEKFNKASFVTMQPTSEVRVSAKKPGTATIRFRVNPGYHVNSNAPADEFLIPLRCTWTEDVVKVQDVLYPKPQMQKFAFSEKPMSVYEGDVKTQVKFKVPASAPRGLIQLTGKLRYQACNDRMCLPPRTLEVKVPLEIRN